MKIAVVVFPGTQGERDCARAFEHVLASVAGGSANESTGEGIEGQAVEPTTEPVGERITGHIDFIQHTDTDLASFDCIILPGGSSYGDYLRCGALASVTPVMDAVQSAAAQGRMILGIGNGFQILLEAGLLPGVMRPNEQLTFHSGLATLRVDNSNTPFTCDYEQDERVQMPIAHAAGNYYCDASTLASLQRSGQIVLRYEGENPNGTLDHIAALCNAQGNVLGMMPHPERAMDEWLGSRDGIRIFTSVLKTWRDQHGAAINE